MNNSSGASKRTHCPICRATEGKRLFLHCKDRMFGIQGEWDIRICEQCGLSYTIPQLSESEITKFYLKEYQPYHPPRALSRIGLLRALKGLMTFPYRMRYGDLEVDIRPFGTKTMLDVGCGGGILMKHMHDLGWTTHGIDISEEGLTNCKRKAPDAILIKGTLQDLPSDRKYDLITLSHVIEHLPDPLGTLKYCWNLLEPRGKILIIVPNINSWDAKIFGCYWSGLDLPRHLIHLNEDSAKRLLTSAGFQIENLRPSFLPTSISESLLFLLPNPIRAWSLRSKFRRLLYLGCILPESLLCLMGDKGAIEIIAQKPVGIS